MYEKMLKLFMGRFTSVDSNAIFMVDYETDTSVVREYVTTIDYNKLLSDERNGMIRIMNHTRIGSSAEKA